MIKFWKELGLLILAIVITMLTQLVVTLQHLPSQDPLFTPTHYLLTNLGDMALGGLGMLAIIFIAIGIQKLLPSHLPLFAYVTLVGILICLPDTAVRRYFITYTDKIDFASCCVGLMAFAGLSVGGRIAELKQHSWKIVLIFLIVSTCCFLGGSFVAQLGFSLVGLI